MDGAGEREGEDATLVELDAPTPPRGRRRRLLVLLGCAGMAAVAIAAALPSDPPSQARAGEDETAFGSDADEQAATTDRADPTTTMAESTSTTPEATTTTSPESDTAGRTTSSGSGLDPEDPPDIVTTVPEPTTTTAAPPPWVANHIVLSSVFPPMEDRYVSFSITGAGDWIDIDYGDGSPSERLPAFGCDLWLSPAAPEHALPGPGTYTVTVRVRGSGSCATARSSYRETVATYQLEVG